MLSAPSLDPQFTLTNDPAEVKAKLIEIRMAFARLLNVPYTQILIGGIDGTNLRRLLASSIQVHDRHWALDGGM